MRSGFRPCPSIREKVLTNQPLGFVIPCVFYPGFPAVSLRRRVNRFLRQFAPCLADGSTAAIAGLLPARLGAPGLFHSRLPVVPMIQFADDLLCPLRW